MRWTEVPPVPGQREGVQRFRDVIPAIERAIGVPVAEWEGDCHGISNMVLESGFLEAGDPIRLAYGHYYGPVDPDGYWNERAHLSFQRHGWLVINGGLRVFDVTRWSFENVAPYVWVGPPDPDYDEGGNRVRMAMMRPWPNSPEEERTFYLGLDIGAQDALEALGIHQPPFSLDEIFYLANMAPASYGDEAMDIYEALAEDGHRAKIPIDNWRLVMGEK